MKKAYLLFGLTLLLFELVYSQTPLYRYKKASTFIISSANNKSIELKGKIKSRTTYNYTIPGNLDANSKLWIYQPKKLLSRITSLYAPSGKVVEESTYFEYGNSTTRKTFKYDTASNLIEEEEYNDKDGITWTKTFKYDTANNLIESEDKKNSDIILKRTFKYDSEGNKIATETYYDSGLTQFEYYSFGKLIKEIEKNVNGVVIKNATYKYDEKGNKIEEVIFDSKYISHVHNIDRKSINIFDTKIQYKLTSKTLFKFDSRGKLIEEFYFFPADSISSKKIYKYDLNGNPIEDLCYDSKGIIIWKRTYKYDSKGREIEYFSNQYGERRVEKYAFKYDLNGRPIEWVSYKPDKLSGFKFEDKKTYKYDSNGYIVEINIYIDQGVLSDRITRAFDDRGNLIEENRFGRVTDNVFIKHKSTIHKLEYY
jgi:hypothetical protein